MNSFIEILGKAQLVADLRFLLVHPRIRCIRAHLALHECIDIASIKEGNDLRIGLVLVGQELALLVALGLPHSPIWQAVEY